MLYLLKLFVHVLVSPLKSRARLEAEIVILRQQLMVLRRRMPSKPKLAATDRLLFVWLYRLFPSVFRRQRDVCSPPVHREHGCRSALVLQTSIDPVSGGHGLCRFAAEPIPYANHPTW